MSQQSLVPIVPAGTDDIFVLGYRMAATDFYRESVEREIVPQMMLLARDLAAAFDR